MADSILDDASVALVKAANLPISLAAIEEIIREEDGSEFYYQTHYQHPEWPGGASGVTIMLGYDLGYATVAKVHADLDGKLPPAMVQACASCAEVTGEAAHGLMLRVRNDINIPWSVAFQVFLTVDMPQWVATAFKYIPGAQELPPDCLGAIVSLAYNRGPSFDRLGDRYREMRNIKTDIGSKHLSDVPLQLRSMARLWPIGNGVHARRFREAALFEQGLKQLIAPAVNTTVAAITTGDQTT